MLDRRRLIRVIVAAMPLLAAASAGLAQQSFQRFFPLLIDLPGWKAGKADGAAVQVPGASMVTATRDYRRGDARLDAQVIIGAAAQGALAALQPGMKVETPDARMSTETVNGLQIMRTFQVKDKSGAIVVALAPAAMFNLSFNGVGDDEALDLAKKFDWKAMQAAVGN